jgi:hypothetical protein
MMGAGGGGGGNEVGSLAAAAADRRGHVQTGARQPKMAADKFRETTVPHVAQAKLREQVEELSEKMNSRLDVVDPAFKTIVKRRRP